MTEGSCHCGAARWRFRGRISSATICNCTVCRRYGVLWAYGHEGEDITVEAGPDILKPYSCGDGTLSFNTCRHCGNLVSWLGLKVQADGRRRIAVNLRLAEPDDVADIPLIRFDGLHSFKPLPDEGLAVSDRWF
ncbi:GFA family protein [Rhizobium halophytocola]|uniref:CENP-V/GFA domain-containing protein n=1 Tax=Rhizobium halophytocola TaxID=735519 RepID=A0ABS4DT95_9HYPH|nr:GFA family protein [Rhizobium halophytocola]MBP1848921.1 hypothetical protein [Rhizobium halophytocola]